MNKWRLMTVLTVLLFVSTSGQTEDAKKYDYTQDWVTKYEKNWHEVFAEYKGKPNVSMLEVGTFEGRGAIWFLDNILTHPTSSVSAIDVFTWPSNETERRFDHNIKVSGHELKVNKLKGKSHEILRKLPLLSYDIIYIDACHDAECVMTDQVMSYYLLKPGGILIWDDYMFVDNPRRTPKEAIDSFLHAFETHLQIIYKGYQMIVRKTGKTWYE